MPNNRFNIPNSTQDMQSAPMTAAVPAMQQDQMPKEPLPNDGSIDGFKALAQVIGKEQIHKAVTTLQKYKAGKANLEQRIIDNEQWYKLRHWESMRRKAGSEKTQVEPTSAWMFNFLENKLADCMDNFPMPNVKPREKSDQQEAKTLEAIIPVVLDQNEFEQVYEDVNRYKLMAGTGVYGVFWDNTKLNGLGDISIKKVDIIKLFWEPGISDIQDSHNLFLVELVDNEDLESEYPQLQNKLSTSSIDISQYIWDDTIDTSEKSAVVDWYYRKRQNGKNVLHYCKFVNDEVLFATENEPNFADRGWYDHGKYPFVFDSLFPVEGTPAGFGYIDVGKSCQEYIDRLGKAIMENALHNATPRFFFRSDGSVNEEEYADLTKGIVHVDGNMGTDSIYPITSTQLPSIYETVLNNKIEELKEVTGNRDVNTGGTASGVTAASAIAAIQESGSKLSRKDSKAAYRAYRQIILLVIELIRQFYDTPRQFRITGDNGGMDFVSYSNQNIVPQAQGNDFGIDMGYRLPVFDCDVSAEKQSPYSKMSQNELALQFYQAGFFNPQMTDQALATLEMMDFNRKDFIMERIAQNGTIYQQNIQLQQMALQLATMVDQDRGTNLAEQMAAGMTGQAAPPVMDGNSEQVQKNGNLGGSNDAEESSITKNAREKVANSTDPT